MKILRTMWFRRKDESINFKILDDFSGCWNSMCTNKKHQMGDMGVVSIEAGHPDEECLLGLYKEYQWAILIETDEVKAHFRQSDVEKLQILEVLNDVHDISEAEFNSSFDVVNICSYCGSTRADQKRPLVLNPTWGNNDLIALRHNYKAWIAYIASYRTKELLTRFAPKAVEFIPVLNAANGAPLREWFQMRILNNVELSTKSPLLRVNQCEHCKEWHEIGHAYRAFYEAAFLINQRSFIDQHIAALNVRCGFNRFITDAAYPLVVSGELRRQINVAKLKNISYLPAYLVPQDFNGFWGGETVFPKEAKKIVNIC